MTFPTFVRRYRDADDAEANSQRQAASGLLDRIATAEAQYRSSESFSQRFVMRRRRRRPRAGVHGWTSAG